MTSDERKKADNNPGDQQDQVQQAGKADNAAKDEKVLEAHAQAEKDIEEDPDFSPKTENDDLDEGETARLGEETTDPI